MLYCTVHVLRTYLYIVLVSLHQRRNACKDYEGISRTNLPHVSLSCLFNYINKKTLDVSKSQLPQYIFLHSRDIKSIRYLFDLPMYWIRTGSK